LNPLSDGNQAPHIKLSFLDSFGGKPESIGVVLNFFDTLLNDMFAKMNDARLAKVVKPFSVK